MGNEATAAAESPLREEHAHAGASTGVWFSTQLPADYGNFEQEYRQAGTIVAVVDTNFQFVAELTGPDRVRYLNAVTTANINDLQPGESAIGLLLNAQAHILAELRVLALADRLMVLSHAMVAGRTFATLDKFIIMDDATLADHSSEFGMLALVGPVAEKVTTELTGMEMGALAEGAHVEVHAGGIPCRVMRACSLGLRGVEWIVARNQLTALWRLLVDAADRHGGSRAGYRAIDALRLEEGLPWFGVDFDDRVIPQEAGIEQSHISYTKGCYTGQEIVERVRSRGQVNRRLVGLAFEANAVPKPGEPLLSGSETVGRITSAAFSPRAGGPIGFGYLTREFHAPGSRVQWQHGTAEVIALPLAGITEH